MTRLHSRLLFPVFGLLLLLHTTAAQTGAAVETAGAAAGQTGAAAGQTGAATGQTGATAGQLEAIVGQTGVAGTAPSPGAAVVPTDPTAATPNIRTDVTDTVMALLNETGYSGSANDANVQEIVAMLMNGTVPTDADLIRLGFIPQPALTVDTTPVPYTIPGNPAVIDTNIGFPTGNLPTANQGPAVPQGPSIGGFPNGGFPIGGFPSNPQIGGPTGSQGGGPSNTGSQGSTDPFGGALSPPVGGGGVFPNFPSMLPTTPKPALGDPFNLNTITGAVLPALSQIDPNALGPKPFQTGGPIGALGTPGATTDLLGSLGTPPLGLDPMGQPPQTGILDAPQTNRNRNGGMMSNPMMMMMMMNPELMDQALSGENPMLMMMLMQQMNRRPPRPRPSLSGMTPGMDPLSGLGGAGGLPLTGSPAGGAGSGGLMDLVNSLGPLGGGTLPGPGALAPAGGTPTLDLASLGGLGAPAGAVPGGPAVGGNPMDLLPTSAPSPGGAAAGGPTDMGAFLNMMNNAPAAGTAPSATPLTDPFVGTAG